MLEFVEGFDLHQNLLLLRRELYLTGSLGLSRLRRKHLSELSP